MIKAPCDFGELVSTDSTDTGLIRQLLPPLRLMLSLVELRSGSGVWGVFDGTDGLEWFSMTLLRGLEEFYLGLELLPSHIGGHSIDKLCFSLGDQLLLSFFGLAFQLNFNLYGLVGRWLRPECRLLYLLWLYDMWQVNIVANTASCSSRIALRLRLPVPFTYLLTLGFILVDLTEFFGPVRVSYCVRDALQK